MLEFCLEFGIAQVTVYAFSQDNFARPKEEVDNLMLLALRKFEEFVHHESLVARRGVRVTVLSTSPHLVPPDVRAACHRVQVATAKNTGALLNICFSYSGTAELAQAVSLVSRAVASGEVDKTDVNEALISRVTTLATGAPDVLVRTSGESRLSDFLLWHVADAQVLILATLWPDLSVLLLGIVLLASAWKPRGARALPPLSAKATRFVARVHDERLAEWTM